MTGGDAHGLLRRPASKAVLDPRHPYAVLREEERGPDGAPLATTVVFLTNRECPFRCVMCDLWVHTLDTSVAPGDIVRQVREALEGRPPPQQIKLYNAGSFFDPAAIPPGDLPEVARLLRGVDRVVVESHPAFLRGRSGEQCLRFRDALDGRLEVAIGLETAQADVLARLNKAMTLESFAAAAGFLIEQHIDLRAFILLQPPFTTPADAVPWACRSLHVAEDCGATVMSVIPTRRGNPEMEADGEPFAPPRLQDLEAVMEYAVERIRGRVFADLWDAARCSMCSCAPARIERLGMMNRTGRPQPRICCACEGLPRAPGSVRDR